MAGHAGGSSIYSLEVLVTGIICLGLGMLMLRRNPYLKISQLFLIAMCMIAVYCSSMFLLRNASSDGMAGIFARSVLLSGVLASASVMYFSLSPSHEVQGAWSERRKQGFFVLTAAAALLVAVLPVDVDGGELGYWWVPSPSTLVWVVVLAILTILPMLMLNNVWDRTEDGRLKRHCTLLSIALFLPFSITLLDIFLEWSVLDAFSLLPLGLLATSLIFTYITLSYKPFNLPDPVAKKEAPAPVITKVSLVSGVCDLFKSKKADAAYRTFNEELESGSRGLLITNIHPDQVREKFGPVKAPIMWLSGQPGPDRLDPTALSIIQHTMVDFLQKGERSVLLLDGLDYLISENQLDKVLKMIYAVHDAVVVSGAKFIVPIDPLTIDSKDLAFIEKEFVVIEDAGSAAVNSGLRPSPGAWLAMDE